MNMKSMTVTIREHVLAGAKAIVQKQKEETGRGSLSAYVDEAIKADLDRRKKEEEAE